MKTSSPLISIDRPCYENLSQMPKCGEGFYCRSCCHTVTDLRKKDLASALRFVEQNQGACMIVNKKHLEGKEIQTHRVGMFFKKMGMVKTAAVLVSILLLFSSCYRKVKGCVAYGSAKQAKMEKL